jgi:antirestriction protein ArdC
MSSQRLARNSRTFTAERRAEYRQQKRSEQREAIERATRALLSSDGWRAWAETRATFHEYSMGNCMLIAMQRPEATQVAGFNAWKQLGRQVRKGEHGIRIMAPMVVKQRDADGETDDDAETRVVFRTVSVFDVAQTDGEPLPEPPCEPITGDSHERYIEPLKDLARSMGVAVYEYEPNGEAQGFYDVKGRRIVVSDRLAPNGKVRTLVQELAHAHGVLYSDYPRADAEVIVETAAYIVCGALGLDTSGESVPYIAGWGEANDVEAIRKHAETVDSIAASIEQAYGVKGGAR